MTALGAVSSIDNAGRISPALRRWGTPTTLLVLAGAALALLAMPSLAHASFGGHTFSATIAGSGSTALSNPTSVAVDDSSGDIYVTDPAHHRVEKFDSSGNFLLMFGKNVNSGTGNPNICTNAGPPTDVCQAGTSTTSPGGFEELMFVAVDNSSGPSAGDVYTGDAEYPAPISKFDSSGQLITGWGKEGQIIGSPAEPEWYTIYGGMTVDDSGNLYVYSYGGMFKFDQSGAWEETHYGPGPAGWAGIAVDPAENTYIVTGEEVVEKRSPFAAFESLGQPTPPGTEVRGLASESISGDLYVDAHGTELQRYAPFCSNPCAATESFGTGHLNSAKGLAVNPASSTIYVANTGDSDVAVFTSDIVPNVTEHPILGHTTSSVTVDGTVDPAGGSPITECYFEYGETISYSLGTVPCTPDPTLANFTESTEVTGVLSNLQILTVYHYRLVATSDKGTSYGRDQTAQALPNAPAVSATAASDITSESATLNAEINPGLGSTVYRYQYGPTTAYGHQTPPSKPIGSDNTDHLASTAISELVPGDTYHFRALATNFTGTTFGPDQSFTTPSPPSVLSTSVSSITQASAVVEAQINPDLSPTSYHVDYGPTEGYGSSTPESAPIGADGSAHSASVVLLGLEPGMTYHYRILATNSVGEAAGVDSTFATVQGQQSGPILITCQKGFVKRHGRCVRRKTHHKRHHRRHAHA